MKKQSAGILLYRTRDGVLEVFLVHPGGPYFESKDNGVWSIPKGEFKENEGSKMAALREFEEETGFKVENKLELLGVYEQSSQKIIHVWYAEDDCDASQVVSNTFKLEWPPKSGKMCEFPEIDKASWFNVGTAMEKINKGQKALLKELSLKLGHPLDGTRKVSVCESCGAECCRKSFSFGVSVLKKEAWYLDKLKPGCVNENMVMPFNDEDHCPFLDKNNWCTIYSKRPDHCRRYECGRLENEKMRRMRSAVL